MADGVEAFARLGFDADLLRLNAERGGKLLPHARNVRGQLGALEADRGVDVHDGISGLLEQTARVAKEKKARSVSPFRRRVRKVPANIPQRGRPQERVADGVREHVTVRVADRALVEGDSHAAENQLSARGETMQIVADANAVRRVNSEE